MSANPESPTEKKVEISAEEREQKIQALHEFFGLTDQDKERELSKIKESKETPEAVRVGYQRSYENMRDSLDRFIKLFESEGKSIEEVSQELQQEAEKIKESLSLGFCCDLERCLQILSKGSIGNAYDIKPEEMRSGLDEKVASGYLQRRAKVERGLGWYTGEVATLALDDQTDDKKNGTAKQWGYIRFVCDYNKLKGTTTFTQGDSMSSGITGGISSLGNAESRQLCDTHTVLAKSMFNVLRRQESSSRAKAYANGYIEAQVPISKLDVKDNVSEVVIDLEQLFREYIYATNKDNFFGELFKEEYGVSHNDVAQTRKASLFVEPQYVLKADQGKESPTPIAINPDFKHDRKTYKAIWLELAKTELAKIQASLTDKKTPFRFSDVDANKKPEEILPNIVERFIDYRYNLRS